MLWHFWTLYKRTAAPPYFSHIMSSQTMGNDAIDFLVNVTSELDWFKSKMNSFLILEKIKSLVISNTSLIQEEKQLLETYPFYGKVCKNYLKRLVKFTRTKCKTLNVQATSLFINKLQMGLDTILYQEQFSYSFLNTRQLFLD